MFLSHCALCAARKGRPCIAPLHVAGDMVITLDFKAGIMDVSDIRRALVRISHEIIENNKGTDGLCIIGILRRGKPLADMICANIEKIEGTSVPCGDLDIRFYRDDLTHENTDPSCKNLSLPFSIEGKKVVLVDDVIFTGRTARAAIEAVFTLGRPSSIQLAVLVDRGHRELPIRADYVGKNIPTSRNEVVKVTIPPFDEEAGVTLYER